MTSHSHSAATGASFNEEGGQTVACAPMDHTMKNSTVTPLGQASFLSEGNVRLTPAQAGFILRELGYDRNRPIEKSPGHVATLAEIMRRGSWLPKSQIAFARFPDGSLVLINGHHRMAAQAQSNADIVWNVIIYDVADDEGLRRLYTRFDTNVKTRSENNILGAVDFADRNGLSRKGATGLYRAAPIIANGLQAVKMGNRGGSANFAIRIAEDRIALMESYINEARAYDKASEGCPVKIRTRLLSGGVMAVGLVTFRADRDAAWEFWHGIAENDGLRKGDPRSTFLQWLMDGNNRGNAQPPIVAAARAWNYWVAGNDLRVIKIHGNGLNITGTTYWVSA